MDAYAGTLRRRLTTRPRPGNDPAAGNYACRWRPRGGSSDERLVRRGRGRPARPCRHGRRAAPEAAAAGLERPAPGHAPGVAGQPRRPRRPAPPPAPRPAPGPWGRRPPAASGPPAPALGAARRRRPAGAGRAAGRARGLGRLPAQPGRRPARLRRPPGRHPRGRLADRRVRQPPGPGRVPPPPARHRPGRRAPGRHHDAAAHSPRHWQAGPGQPAPRLLCADPRP